MLELLEKISNIYKKDEAEVLSKAYYFAKEAHKGQKRASGEEYFTHPCAVAEILIGLGMDYYTIAAAFLHDVIEDTPVTEEDIRREFGETVLTLVMGVTKLDKIEFKSHEEEQAENFKKIFVSMAKDIRVIIIKLADRLHNMRSLNFLSQERQLRMAHETLEIYAPLAGRLGISQIKCELEDLCLKYIDPKAYEYLSENIHAKLEERRVFVSSVVKEIKEILDSPNFNQEEAIAQQIKLLELQYKHIGELISFAREIQTKGVKTMNFEVFDTNEIEQYKAEVKSKWGNSKAYQEYEQRVVSHSEHNDSKFVNEIMSLFTDLGAMKQLPPTDKAVQEKIAALQAYINENFYTCSNGILKELGEMYVCDDRFKKNIDRFGGEGTAKFVREAIFVYCEK